MLGGTHLYLLQLIVDDVLLMFYGAFELFVSFQQRFTKFGRQLQI